MDDLLREFLVETGEHLDTVDVELVRFEQQPSDGDILRNIFRLVHTIKGTCGFLGLPRLEYLAHAAEALMERLRDGAPPTREAVSLILATVDRLKLILSELERLQAEPPGSDADLIGALERAAQLAGADAASREAALQPIPDQVLLRPLRPGEVPLDELERVFHATPGPGSAPGPEPEPERADREPARAEPSDAAAGEREAGQAMRTHTVRVSIDTLERLLTMVSELVLTRNQLLDMARRSDSPDGFKAPLQRLSHVTAELQNGVMKTRMQPVRSAWSKLPRVIRDLSLDLGKDLALVMEGGDTELDRQVLEIIRDPLTHMVRNAADHGIEPPAARRRAGKPAQGTIRLNAFQEGGTITIEVSDDGRGLDHAAVRRQAVAMELVSTADALRMSDEQVAELIFHPGFSTAAAVGAVSGRGVGMDVVKSNIGLIGGTIEIASTPGRGSTFRIKIPLTLAIVAALIVQVGSQRFALPQLSVVELVRVGPGAELAIERVGGAALLRLRNAILPVVDLAGLMGFEASRAESGRGFVIVTEVGRQRFGLLVDGVLETEEIVVKPMSRLLKDLQLFSGNTIMGDGAVVLIVDPNGIARRIGAEVLRNVPDGAEPGGVTAIAQTDTILVFRGADGAPKALPLSLVMRLEEVDAAAIEWSGGQPRLQYRGRLVPVVPVDDGALRRDGQQPLVIVSDGERLTGLAVREIIDVVECVLDIQPGSAGPGRVGSAIVRGRATDIVDLAAFLPRSQDGWGVPSGVGEAATVLLVDDNPFFRDMLSPVLRASGYRVKTACGVEDALHLLQRGGVELLVTDLDLGGQSGFELVERVRARPETARMHVVALSSGAGEKALRRARELDIFDVVAKFDRSGLLAALAETRAQAGALADYEAAA
jgi:two-component system chemotaxis sensor kinase CheA